MLPNFEQLVDRKVHDRFEELNGTVERLIAAAIDRELDKLVAGLVETNIEHRANPSRVKDLDEPASKVCKTCRRELPLSAFEKNRGSCRECRREQARSRERRPAASGPDLAGEKEPPRPGGPAGAQNGS